MVLDADIPVLAFVIAYLYYCPIIFFVVFIVVLPSHLGGKMGWGTELRARSMFY